MWGGGFDGLTMAVKERPVANVKHSPEASPTAAPMKHHKRIMFRRDGVVDTKKMNLFSKQSSENVNLKN